MSCACGKGTCNCAAPVTLNLMDEHGTTHSFYVADRINIDDRKYAFAIGLENSEQMALLRIDQNADGEETYSNIVNESEWEAIRQYIATAN